MEEQRIFLLVKSWLCIYKSENREAETLSRNRQNGIDVLVDAVFELG